MKAFITQIKKIVFVSFLAKRKFSNGLPNWQSSVQKDMGPLVIHDKNVQGAFETVKEIKLD